MKEARSLVRDEKAFIKVVFKEKNVQAKESVAVDISSMAEIVVGKDDVNYIRILTCLDEVYHWKSLAENL